MPDRHHSHRSRTGASLAAAGGAALLWGVIWALLGWWGGGVAHRGGPRPAVTLTAAPRVVVSPVPAPTVTVRVTVRPDPQAARPRFTIPAGASARCRDGTYSFLRRQRGSCARHGGVRVWLRFLPP